MSGWLEASERAALWVARRVHLFGRPMIMKAAAAAPVLGPQKAPGSSSGLWLMRASASDSARANGIARSLQWHCHYADSSAAIAVRFSLVVCRLVRQQAQLARSNKLSKPIARSAAKTTARFHWSDSAAAAGAALALTWLQLAARLNQSLTRLLS